MFKSRLILSLDKNLANSEHQAMWKQVALDITEHGHYSTSDCSDELLQKVAETICTVRLISADNGKLQSVIDSPCDLLIVPQFCLAGKLKRKSFQYHGAVSKATAEKLYCQLVKLCDSFLKSSSMWLSKSCKFSHGTFGIRQVLSLETNGPFTHITLNAWGVDAPGNVSERYSLGSSQQSYLTIFSADDNVTFYGCKT
ncbi:D-aminoacyl-tRNA deacylase 2 [Schistosoma japonicum]|nr:D-aminoacyl-tRNA deacylase 2 [Schistosoma japonicum]